MAEAIELTRLASTVSSSPSLEELKKDIRADRRKAALEKIASGKKLIESLNWKNESGQDPLAVLPSEIWHDVLLYVDDPEDLKTAMDTCPLFKDILEGRRVRDILMPLALDVDELKNALKQSPQGRNSLMETFCELKAPVKLRQVCKSWRDTIDRSLETIVEKLDFAQDKSEDWVPILRLECPTPSQIQNEFLSCALSNFPLEVGNNAMRFITKAVSVTILDPGNRHMEWDLKCLLFYSKFAYLLESIGGQVLSLELNLDGPNIPWLTLYSFLQRWVSRMPNLKFLKIVDCDGNENAIVQRDTSYVSFKTAIKDVELPHFPHLKELQVLHVNITKTYELFYITQEILKLNPKIEELTLFGVCYPRFEEIGEIIGSLSLTTLNTSVSVLKILPLYENSDRWQDPFFHNMTSISLDFSGISELYASTLFYFLNSFWSLKKIKLDLPKVKLKGEFDDSFCLPELTHFEFSNSTCYGFGARPPPLIFTFSAAPFLMRKNPKELVWMVKSKYLEHDGPPWMYTDVKLEPGKLSVRCRGSQEEKLWHVINFSDLKDISVINYAMRYNDNREVPTIRLANKEWWSEAEKAKSLERRMRLSQFRIRILGGGENNDEAVENRNEGEDEDEVPVGELTGWMEVASDLFTSCLTCLMD